MIAFIIANFQTIIGGGIVAAVWAVFYYIKNLQERIERGQYDKAKAQFESKLAPNEERIKNAKEKAKELNDRYNAIKSKLSQK